MKTNLKTEIGVKEICDGFVYNELEGKGLFGLSGRLTIQPDYQRNYTETEMRGIEWGRLYEQHHKKPYDTKAVSAKLQELYGDAYVKNRKGVFEYILGGCTDTKLLEIRVFDEAIKKAVSATQTQKANAKNKSNCPLCAEGHDANKSKIWSSTEMDADHVQAWSKGGQTNIKNCQMLCKTHNRAKGNR